MGFRVYGDSAESYQPPNCRLGVVHSSCTLSTNPEPPNARLCADLAGNASEAVRNTKHQEEGPTQQTQQRVGWQFGVTCLGCRGFCIAKTPTYVPGMQDSHQ